MYRYNLFVFVYVLDKKSAELKENNDILDFGKDKYINNGWTDDRPTGDRPTDLL